MPFGRQAGPQIVYSYGIVKVEQPEIANEQLWAAHRYRNKLCELELERRKECHAVISNLAPEVPRIEGELAELQAKIETVTTAIKRQRQIDRKATPVTKESKAKLAELKRQRKEKAAELKAAKATAYARPDVKSELTQVTELHKYNCKAASAESIAAWGTRGQIDAACRGFGQGMPPRFNRWTGEGKLAVQCQASCVRLDAARLLSCEDTRLRLEPIDGPGTNRHRIWFRVGSENRNPVWLTAIVAIHRPLPSDAVVKWAYMVCRKRASKQSWSLQFVLQRDSGWEKTRGEEGTAAVNLGFRAIGDDMRAAYVVDHLGIERELILPHKLIRKVDEARRRQSRRDVHFDEIRAKLVEWKQSHKCPEWFTEATKTIGQWRSEAKLAAVILRWRDERWDGDAEMFATCEDWRKHDKHHWEREAGHMRRFQAARLGLYRNFVADLRRQYKALLIGDVKWKAMGEKPDVTETDDAKRMRERSKIASPGMLQEMLIKAFGDDAVKVDAKDLTATCHICGQLSETKHPQAVQHECQHCRSTYDQDRNHCLNLLARERQGAECDATT